MVFLNLYLQSFLFLLGKRDPCFAQLKLPVAGFERGSWVFWVHHQEEVGALAGMKAKRGPRFKSSDKAESKPLQWKISKGACLQETKTGFRSWWTEQWPGTLLDSGHRMGVCYDTPDSEFQMTQSVVTAIQRNKHHFSESNWHQLHIICVCLKAFM